MLVISQRHVSQIQKDALSTEEDNIFIYNNGQSFWS
jgi:hypothetical protein